MIDTAAEGIGRTRWVHLVPVIFLMYTISYFDRINIGLALPSMSKDLHLTPANAGLAAGIFFWGYLISFLAAGWLAPRFGAKRVILSALICWGLFAIGTGLATDFAFSILAVLGVIGGLLIISIRPQRKPLLAAELRVS